MVGWISFSCNEVLFLFVSASRISSIFPVISLEVIGLSMPKLGVARVTGAVKAVAESKTLNKHDIEDFFVENFLVVIFILDSPNKINWHRNNRVHSIINSAS